MKLFLASNSPRRKDILTKNGYEFSIKSSSFEENAVFLDPIELTKANAFGKAKSVFDQLNSDNVLVLGADTIVYYDGKVIGKPKNEEDALRTLKKLSGNTHSVFTGYALIYNEGIITGCCESKVKFKKLSDKFINDYISTGSPMDKAGSYGIQDDFPIVHKIEGSLNNVIGLPIEELKPILDKILKKQ